MFSIISRNKNIFIVWGILILVASVFLALHGKAMSHLILNSFHNIILDAGMRYITILGDGSIMIIIAFLLLFRKVRFSLILFVSFLSSSLVVQLLKRLVFTNYPRPVKYFEDTVHTLYLIPGLKYHSWFSFPSGHSATAFALFTGLALIVKNQGLKLVFFLIACITAYSRVYLSQHFLVDIIAGSAIGIFCALISHYWISGIEKNWMDSPVYKVFGSG